MNRYRIKNVETGELAAVSHNDPVLACREVGWDPDDCHVLQLRSTKDWVPIKRYVAPKIDLDKEK